MITGGEQLLFVVRAAAPDRSDSVNDMPGLQPVPGGYFRRSGRAAAERSAFGQQFRPGRAMNGAIHTAAAQQALIGGIHDDIDVETGDVGDHNFKPRRSDLGGANR
jgi:hypothetical protein